MKQRIGINKQNIEEREHEREEREHVIWKITLFGINYSSRAIFPINIINCDSWTFEIKEWRKGFHLYKNIQRLWKILHIKNYIYLGLFTRKHRTKCLVQWPLRGISKVRVMFGENRWKIVEMHVLVIIHTCCDLYILDAVHVTLITPPR